MSEGMLFQRIGDVTAKAVPQNRNIYSGMYPFQVDRNYWR